MATKEPEQLSKMSVKTILGKKPQAPENGKVETLFTVFGVANSFREDESAFGEYTEFRGNFEAVRVDDGGVFRSNKLFLPDAATVMLRNALVQAPRKSGVEMAFEIAVKGDEESSTGYVYGVKSLVKQAFDPLAALKEKIKLPAQADTAKGKTAKK